MARTAPQNEPSAPAPMPSVFDEDLVKRCFPHRFRKIGSPFAYLNDIGIVPILEFICKGHLLIDVAEATDVPFITLRRWIENEGHFDAVAEAETLSAEGFLAEATRRLRHAPTEFELRRAKEMLRHGQYMAEKKNKPLYGDHAQKNEGSTVQYVFNVGASHVAPLAQAVIEGESKRMAADTAADKPKKVSLNLGQMYGIDGNKWPVHDLGKPMLMEHLANDDRPVLVVDRPSKPTAILPDTGPFYDDPNDQENTVLPEHYEVRD